METKTLGKDWLKFTNNILLPFGAIMSVIRILMLIGNADSLPQGYVGGQVLSALVSLGLSAALFFGLKQFKSWAWYLMLVMLVLTPIGAAISRIPGNAGNQGVTVALLIIGFLAWTLPNVVYFYRRRTWFGISPDILVTPQTPNNVRPPSLPSNNTKSADSGRASRPPSESSTSDATAIPISDIAYVPCACGKNNRAGVKFCGACGKPMQWACSECGSLNDSPNVFCQHCGLDHARHQAAKDEIDELSKRFDAKDWRNVVSIIRKYKAPEVAQRCEKALADKRCALVRNIFSAMELELEKNLLSAEQTQLFASWAQVADLARLIISCNPETLSANEVLDRAMKGVAECKTIEEAQQKSAEQAKIAKLHSSLAASVKKATETQSAKQWDQAESIAREILAIRNTDQEASKALKSTSSGREICRFISELSSCNYEQVLEKCKLLREKVGDSTITVSTSSLNHTGPISALELLVKEKQTQQKILIRKIVLWGFIVFAVIAAVSFTYRAVIQQKAKKIYQQGMRCKTGEGGVTNLIEAETYFRTAAGLGNVEAMVQLGNITEHSANTEEAVQWYRKAAEKDLPEGQCRLGACYERGLG
ncbi:MAG: zinc ribbon domain-containing protein, partial [bacterium]